MNEENPLLQQEFENEIREGLSARQKHLPSKYLYDRLGSILFEAICALPEYYLTRTERRILEQHAGDIVHGLQPDAQLVELGAGSAVKTQILIDRLLQDRDTLVYCPIDISQEALRSAEANIVSRFPQITFKGIEGDWFETLGRLSNMEPTQKLIVFLGSSIGNLEHRDSVAFLDDLRRRMNPDDLVLLGTDMVKPVPQLIAAYDDPVGVTAAFNRNLLVRLNQELEADFDPRAFAHEARWNEEHLRVEMHLVARRPHTVHVRRLGLEVPFETGESIHTENSHKFTRERIDAIADQADLFVSSYWHDGEDRFRLNLLAQKT